MEPLDTLSMGEEDINTIPARKNDEFIKSSGDDRVPIPKESEVTSVSIDLECSIPIDTPPLPCTNVLGEENLDIDLPFREQVDTLLMEDKEINLNSLRGVKNLGIFLADDHVPILRMFNEPFGDSESMSRSSETKGDILYLEQLLNEDTFSDVSPVLLPKESSLLVLPLTDYKQICLRKVERFDPFFLSDTVG
ncbi:hypothetical protein Tco_1296601 [Tanacetum coccineum]